MREIIINPEPSRMSSPEEIENELKQTLGFIVRSSRDKTGNLTDSNEGSKQDVKRAIKRLSQRTAILMEGFDRTTDPSMLGIYNETLKNFTEAMHSALEIAKSNSMLADIVDRFGQGLQSGMERFGLIDEQTKQKLSELDNPPVAEEDPLLPEEQ